MLILFLFSRLKTLTSASRVDAIRMLCAITRRDRSPVSADQVFTAMDSPALQVSDIVRNVLSESTYYRTYYSVNQFILHRPKANP